MNIFYLDYKIYYNIYRIVKYEFNNIYVNNIDDILILDK